MCALDQALDDYLSLHRSLGRKYVDHGIQLPQFVAYLEHGRPVSKCRRLFLRADAPLGLSATAVADVVRRACVRAGMSPVGPHRLRHSAATAMLRAGASLDEVGQVLRQRDAAVTAHYAKVDFVALRQLAAPWPGDAA